ncbi:MAG: RNB domain-containing ribonuclease, partial [Clostridia bacterium]|nr:RNB domain-containing ribonuclease [Clostridia bacterium]
QGEDIIHNRNGPREMFADVAQGVLDGAEAAKEMKAQWKEGGFLDCESPDPNMHLSEDGEHVVNITNDNGTLAHSYVECSMLGYNIVFAQHATDKDLDIIYRVEQAMAPEKEMELETLCASLGLTYTENLNYIIDEARAVDARNKDKILADSKHSPYLNLYPYSSVVSQLIIRRQFKAAYSAENIGHYATTFEQYAQATAPVRRATDCVDEWQLLDDELGTHYGFSHCEIVELCEHFNDREDNITVAERDQTQACGVKWASENIANKVVDARIISMTNEKITVEWNFLNITIPVETLGDMFDFKLTNYNSVMVNNKKKIMFIIGQKLKVKVEDFDIATATVTGKVMFGNTKEADVELEETVTSKM